MDPSEGIVQRIDQMLELKLTALATQLTAAIDRVSSERAHGDASLEQLRLQDRETMGRIQRELGGAQKQVETLVLDFNKAAEAQRNDVRELRVETMEKLQSLRDEVREALVAQRLEVDEERELLSERVSTLEKRWDRTSNRLIGAAAGSSFAGGGVVAFLGQLFGG